MTNEPEYEVRVGNGPWNLDGKVIIRRIRADDSRVTVWEGTTDDLGETLHEAAKLIGYAATANVRSNKSWMEGLGERINELLRRLGDDDRVRFLVTNFCVEKAGP